MKSLKPANNWIPVGDALPDAPEGYWSDEVLVVNSAGVIVIDSLYHGEETRFWLHHRGDVTARPTHWMPLPKAPKSSGKNKWTPRPAMVRINGKSFRCPCGCNVFTEYQKMKYRCNSCETLYEGE